MNVIESEKVQTTSFFNKNNFKHGVFYALCICTLGILYLVFRWFPHLFAKLYDKCPEGETYNFINVKKVDEDEIIVEVHRREVRFLPNQPISLLTFLKFEDQIYYLDEELNLFRLIETIMMKYLNNNPTNFLESMNGLEEDTVKELLDFYGENMIEIPDKPYIIYLLQDLFSPLILFQMMTCIVFSIIGYLIFGFVIGVITVFTAMTMAYERLIANKKMRAIADYETKVHVIRNINNVLKDTKISSRKLVIGDIVRVQNGDMFTVDMILVKGSCLVSEAVLTGEANPVRKVGLFKDTNIGNCVIAESNLIHCGSHCIMTKSDIVEAIVIRTGWSTSKGELVSNIVHSKPVEFKFRNDVYKILLVLFCIGLFFVVVLLFIQVNSGHFLWNKFIDKSLEILTVALPPALIISFTVGIKAANTNLKEKNILPVIIDKINEAGRVKYLCFDKTGTLTENNVKIGGFLIDTDFEKREISFELTELLNNYNYKELMEVMSCCHSLQLIHENVAGDPLDEEMFFKTGFILHEVDVNGDSRRYIKPTKEFRKLRTLEPDFRYEILQINDFTPERKRMSVIVSNNYNKEVKGLIKGAPEQIKTICTQNSIPANYDEIIAEFSQKGYRIIGLAAKEYQEDQPKNFSTEEAENQVTFVGFVLLNNPLKPETLNIITKLKKVDIVCKMVTGDNIYTSLNVACACGILESHENIFLGVLNPKTKLIKYIYFTAQDLREKMTISQVNNSNFSVPSIKHQQDSISRRQVNTKNTCNSLSEVIFKCKSVPHTKIAMDGIVYDMEIGQNPDFAESLIDDFFEYAIIFSRASPKQKESIVEKLKNSQKCKKNVFCVGFVGDGSNDSKALRIANIGLSLGTNESSIASSFNTKTTNIGPIIEVLIEGRANLELSIQNFKFIMVTGIFQFFSITCLSFYNLDYNTAQYLMFDVLTIIPLALLMCRTKAVDDLNKNIPRVSILNFQILSSIICHLVLSMIYLAIAIYMIFFNPFSKSAFDITGVMGHIFPDGYSFYENNLFIFFVDVVSIIACFAVNHGYPFRKSLFTNLLFCIYGFVWLVLHVMFVYVYEMDAFYLTKYFVKFRMANYGDHDLKHIFLVFSIICCFITFLLEKLLNEYFLLKKRQQNQILSKEKNGLALTVYEKENKNFLFDIVSVN